MLNAVYPNFHILQSVNLNFENTKLQRIVHEFHNNLTFGSNSKKHKINGKTEEEGK